jgi:ABC transporter substrate binding protein
MSARIACAMAERGRALVVALAAGCLVALHAPAIAAQGSAKTLHVGILSSGTYDNRGSLERSLLEGLREQGYVEGTNLVIVMVAVSDPVRQGVIASLARPGSNITGTSSQQEDILAKRLELMATVIAKGTTVAVLTNARNPAHTLAWPKLDSAARDLGMNPIKVEITSPDEAPGALQAAARAKAGALS